MVALLLAPVLGACGVLREETFGEAACPPYEEQIQPVLAAQCADCHGATVQEAGYRVTSYFATLRRREDGSARLVPGATDSAFLQAVRGELPGHEALPESERTLLSDWAVRCRAEPRSLRVHQNGWMAPTDEENFHGRVLRASTYDWSTCTDCHGEDLRGGTSGSDCQSCHEQGVMACSTCHGGANSSAPPRALNGARAVSALGVGAHTAHLTDGEFHKAYRCGVCHGQRVTDAEQPGHYREEGGMDLIAEVVLQSAPGVQAEWNREAATCANSMCHAPQPNDANATHLTPVWTSGEKMECGSCHGIPPENHPGDNCGACHGDGFTQTTVNVEVHANGIVDFRGQDGNCSACHGNATSAAPPQDLDGNTEESFRGVGAHRIHLFAERLSGPIACSECHLVPENVNDPGHVDTPKPVEVFPLGAGILARAQNAQVTYDYANGTCTNYCHGSGSGQLQDMAPGINRNPSWTGGTPEIACGSCHGIPPQDDVAVHTPGMPISQCQNCHAPSIDEFGNIRINVDPVTGERSSTHVDGQPTMGVP